MIAEIRDKILIVEAQSEAETLLLKEWRKNWHKTPKAEKWFECRYYNPKQVSKGLKPCCYREYQSPGTLPCETKCEFIEDCKKQSAIKYKEYNDWVNDNIGK